MVNNKASPPDVPATSAAAFVSSVIHTNQYNPKIPQVMMERIMYRTMLRSLIITDPPIIIKM
jgi:hypothetical protein